MKQDAATVIRRVKTELYLLKIFLPLRVTRYEKNIKSSETDYVVFMVNKKNKGILC